MPTKDPSMRLLKRGANGTECPRLTAASILPYQPGRETRAANRQTDDFYGMILAADIRWFRSTYASNRHG